MLEDKYKHLSDIKLFKTISLLCSRLSMIKDCNADYPLPTAMASPISTQANTVSYMCPFLGASTAQSLSLEMQEARAAGPLPAPTQGAAAVGFEAKQGPPRQRALPGTAEGG